MRPSTFWGIILASCYPAAFVQALGDVGPNFPAGDLQTAGQTCHIAWAAGNSSWTTMSIELMTGPDQSMVHLTTLTAGADGSVAGSYSWTCPQVTPNAAIYFYQFRYPDSGPGYGYEWTTRFPIASSSGQVVKAEHATQSDGTPHPWGNGALVDPSSASPPPFMTTGTTTTPTTVIAPPSTSGAPKSVAPGVVAGCTSFFTQPNPSLLCYQVASAYGITVENFEAWNGGSSVCDALEPGLAYCNSCQACK
ncbi:hypothetical protein C0991_010478 [Blastosporella zonata]|nr:hypothetical protein C0991_010478 [Blastosporella zonata]